MKKIMLVFARAVLNMMLIMACSGGIWNTKIAAAKTVGTTKDTIFYFNKISKFKSQDGISFTSDKYSLVFSSPGNVVIVKVGANNIGKINFSRD